MSEKGNGHDPMAVEMISVLKEIRAELGTLNGRVDALNTSLLNEISSLRSETRTELVLIREEVHDLRTEMRGDLGARVRKLEDAVFKRTGS